MNQKKDVDKLQFFSESIPEKLQCEIHKVLQLVQSERITFQRGYEMLHQAHKDLQTIYYQTSARISMAENEITTLRKRGRFTGPQIKADSVLSLAAERSVMAMKTAVRDYRDGLLTKRQLKRARQLMMDCLNQDIGSLNDEIKDTIRTLKVEPKPDRGMDWREEAEVVKKDMVVKKVSRSSVPGSAHDDLA